MVPTSRTTCRASQLDNNRALKACRTSVSKTSSTTQASSSQPPIAGGLQIIIERTFGETRRRVKVIGRLPGEHSCLSLVWAVLDRASAGWRGFTMTPAGLRLLADLRRNLHDPPTPLPQSNSKSTAETGIVPTDSTAIA